jgi:GT2 family glycosyltransferase
VTTKKSQFQPLVSVVVLNWNGIEDTLKCIDSINKLNYKNTELIVVDNGSEDDSVKILKKLNQSFTLITNTENKGFAGGQLTALPYCHGDFIVLLNNDAVIDTDAIHFAIDTFQDDDEIAVVGGRSYRWSEDEGTESTQFYSHQRIDPITGDVHTYGLDDNKIEDVSNVSGACAFIRKAAIEECGYFDPRFFAYYEETDLFARFRRAGWRIVYDPRVHIKHKDGASTKNKKYMYYYLMLRNQFIYAYKNFSNQALIDFKKVYLRNFYRSLWVYLRNGGKNEAIHKARVISTIWNYLNLIPTLRDRRKIQSVNPQFDYNEFLAENNPLPISLVIDATMIKDMKKITNFIENILVMRVRPSEILIVTKKPITTPKQTSKIRVENIVDRRVFRLSVYDYGFMTSNTDLLVYVDALRLKKNNTRGLENDLFNIYRSIVLHDSGLILGGSKSKRQSFNLVKSKNVPVAAIKKSTLVQYLLKFDNIYTIDRITIGHYLNWLVGNCYPIYSQQLMSDTICVNVSPNHSYGKINILDKPHLWYVKNFLIRVHLRKIISRTSNTIRTIKSWLNKKTSLLTKINLRSDEKKLTRNDIDYKNIPIIINTRDRVYSLQKMLKWLENAGYKKIAFIDNQSIYPPLLQLFNKTPGQPIPLGRNGMHRAPWESFAVRFIAKGDYYIVSDPDVIPIESCPHNVVEHFYNLLVKYDNVQKVGFGLKIDDIPSHYALKEDVLKWESRYWKKEIELESNVYRADIDTTFALYKPKTWWSLGPSIRTGGKFIARHDAWYHNSTKPTEEELFYRMRASHEVNTWNKGKLPKHHLRALKKEGLL